MNDPHSAHLDSHMCMCELVIHSHSMNGNVCVVLKKVTLKKRNSEGEKEIERKRGD